ncbi:aldo/keto reductase [Sinisalibacter aestuarii]|uniref:Oxidoreductase n=1 Tax=Sinisalibacter aestuarii TaxID=2949426 RepID=A0ABQ5LYG6_9RHOB|nr:aldo/keto reductase [Sinisalibacter aestuarii]GKY90001.1 oxidoreductase [Sinisalibacter aestuarii]
MSIYFQKTYQRSFGTFPLTGSVLHEAILTAAEIGYRAYDTAQMYGNEAETGAALKATGIARDELCVTTKVDIANFGEAAFLPSVEQSLRDLQLDYVDVLLLHWPTPGGDIAQSLKLLQQAREKGLARHIGVSNYTAQMMRDARAIVDAPLVTNQVEFHPLLNQDKLLAAAYETGIPLASYSSVARGEVFKFPIFAEIGAEYGKTAGQVVLRWILQKGVSINTMSTRRENIAANFDVMDFTLSSVDMARIDEMTANNYRIVGKDLVPYAPDFD